MFTECAFVQNQTTISKPSNNPKTLAFFSVNSNANMIDTNMSKGLNLKNPISNIIENEAITNKESRSLSSSSKFSSSDSSSSVSPPLAGVNTNSNINANAVATANLVINNNNNNNSESQKIFNKFNNKIPFASYNDSNKRSYQNQIQNSTNFNSWDSYNNKKATSTSPFIQTEETGKNYTNFTNNINNSNQFSFSKSQ